jgi:hypothetical protein
MTATNNQSSTQKKFDCLVFKQQAQAQIYKDISSMGSQEIIEYFRQSSRAGVLGQWWKTVTH